jgi:hypothetical protein
MHLFHSQLSWIPKTSTSEYYNNNLNVIDHVKKIFNENFAFAKKKICLNNSLKEFRLLEVRLFA